MKTVFAALAGLCVLLFASAAPANQIYNIIVDSTAWDGSNPDGPFGLTFPPDPIMGSITINGDLSGDSRLVDFSMTTGSKSWTKSSINFIGLVIDLGNLQEFQLNFIEGDDSLGLSSTPTSNLFLLFDAPVDPATTPLRNLSCDQCVTFSPAQAQAEVPVPNSVVLVLGALLASSIARRRMIAG